MANGINSPPKTNSRHKTSCNRKRFPQQTECFNFSMPKVRVKRMNFTGTKFILKTSSNNFTTLNDTNLFEKNENEKLSLKVSSSANAPVEISGSLQNKSDENSHEMNDKCEGSPRISISVKEAESEYLTHKNSSNISRNRSRPSIIKEDLKGKASGHLQRRGRPLQCEFCSGRYMSRKDLILHMTIHTAKKSY
ncbi:unnamed protein product [Thelazia callipaeda]|uniref:C2H2-type domain-containing protein n=1 Tax=Thelazia callipaeda TaxID=103827 RepID=A0A0N5CNK2_THECL|nr:unnamed protein product [Thelazia callipaeda]